ncbi:eamA-like transporter family protein [Collimonas pratensis]|uniref:EamA-like transporter family protein n=1 Tax=Collimonas pratensis TaxID=279113 RepID=A0A127Q2D8_9BURK|nr:eamA-like transporter family protein [Collimonas pratensis]
MKKPSLLGDTLLTAIAPAIWGSTYLVTTQLLPAGHPLMLAMLRALPVGLLLLVLLRQLPSGIWWLRVFVLGALNFTIFWSLLFVSAYRLPGGVAATVGAIQPLLVLLFSWLMFKQAPRRLGLLAGAAGIAGVALLVLTPAAALDAWGIGAGLLGTLSMAIGTTLSKRWRAPVAPLTFTAWQLSAGGLLLLPLALWLEPAACAERAKHRRLRLSGPGRRRPHLLAVVPRLAEAAAGSRCLARPAEPGDCHRAWLAGAGPATGAAADTGRGDHPGQCLARPMGSTAGARQTGAY